MLAQRGNIQCHHLQAIEEILPETPGLHLCAQVFVRRADQADVARNAGRATETFDAPLFDGSQHLGLSERVHVADLIQEERAPMRQLKLALALFARAREGALLMSERARSR